MPVCPSCQSSNVVVTEEVFTRKGKAYYSFLGTLWMVGSLAVFFSFEAYAEGVMVTIAGLVVLKVLSIINAGKRAKSRTKVTCLSCKQKTYL